VIAARALQHDVDRLLFESLLVRVGSWRCPPDHPAFANSGPTTEAFFVFPREPVWIQHEHRAAFVADRNTVTFYNVGEHYGRRRLGARGDRCEWFAVAPAALGEALAHLDVPGSCGRGEPFPFTHGPADTRSYLVQRTVFEHISHEETPDKLFVEETVLTVLGRVAGLAHEQHGRRSRPRQPEARGRDPVEAARSILAARYAERLSLVELARLVGSSVFHLARAFRRRTGFTLHGYRTELRLRAALDSLAGPSSDLMALALDLGFASHSHFTETFRRGFGVPPSEVRRRLTARGPRERGTVG
jgi:AraC-like DNA-binding protein